MFRRRDAEYAARRAELRSLSTSELVARFYEPATMLCLGCGERFRPRRRGQHACGNACRQRVYRWRHGQKSAPYWLMTPRDGVTDGLALVEPLP